MSESLCAVETLPLIDPISGRSLRRDTAWSVSDGESRWPVAAGIPFLRTNRDQLRLAALEALDAGDEQEALALLLTDQDDFARTGPPSLAESRDLIEGVRSDRLTLRSAMALLHYGPVADYFAYRWSSPTYLSGLVLLDRFGGGPDAGPVVEVACGIGHYLRELDGRGRQAVGVDVVFSKLWLARHFVVSGRTPLVCADVAAGWPFGPIPGGAVGFCHDAFYFLPGKKHVLDSLRRCCGLSGRILIGHAHNRNSDHGGVAGEPLTPAEYAAILPDAILFDDAELARSVWADPPATARQVSELETAEALALVWIGLDAPAQPNHASLLEPRPESRLRLNPILRERDGQLEPAWPSPRFEAEYAAASGYLRGEAMPTPATMAAASERIGGAPEIARLTRRRILLDLPERW